MPKLYPREFREDVVTVARKGEDTIAQIAKDGGIAVSCLRNWMHAADVEDVGVRAKVVRRPSSCGSSSAATGSSKTMAGP